MPKINSLFLRLSESWILTMDELNYRAIALPTSCHMVLCVLGRKSPQS